jgi:hypothetical protein
MGPEFQNQSYKDDASVIRHEEERHATLDRRGENGGSSTAILSCRDNGVGVHNTCNASC